MITGTPMRAPISAKLSITGAQAAIRPSVPPWIDYLLSGHGHSERAQRMQDFDGAGMLRLAFHAAADKPSDFRPDRHQ
jgi:hypothetical protein